MISFKPSWRFRFPGRPPLRRSRGQSFLSIFFIFFCIQIIISIFLLSSSFRYCFTYITIFCFISAPLVYRILDLSLSSDSVSILSIILVLTSGISQLSKRLFAGFFFFFFFFFFFLQSFFPFGMSTTCFIFYIFFIGFFLSNSFCSMYFDFRILSILVRICRFYIFIS